MSQYSIGVISNNEVGKAAESRDIGVVILNKKACDTARNKGYAVSDRLYLMSEEDLSAVNKISLSGLIESANERGIETLPELQLICQEISSEPTAFIANPLLLTQLADRGIDLREVGVSVLGFSTGRSIRLARAHIHSIYDLSHCTTAYLLAIRGIGVVGVAEIRQRLNSYLISLLTKDDWSDELALMETPLLVTL